MSYFYPDKVATSPYTIKSLFGIKNKKAKAEQAKKAAEEQPKADTAPEEVAENNLNTVQVEEAPEVDYSKFTKAKLVDLILAQHGADADVSGTKAELLERYFS